MTELKEMLSIQRSNGNSRGGKSVYYIHPAQPCSNKSRKVSGYTYKEIQEKLEKVCKTWYAPIVIYYKIEGFIIGSNSKANALKEYWKICAIEDIGKGFEVKSL